MVLRMDLERRCYLLTYASSHMLEFADTFFNPTNGSVLLDRAAITEEVIRTFLFSGSSFFNEAKLSAKMSSTKTLKSAVQ